MIGLILVLAIIAALAAGLSLGLAMWAKALRRRMRVVLAALLSSALPLSIALVSVVRTHAGPIAFVAVIAMMLVFAIIVGLPVALMMTRNERAAPPLDQTFE